MVEVVLVLPQHQDRQQHYGGKISLAKSDISLLHCWYSFGAVLQCGEVFDIVIQCTHMRDMLLHSGPLGLVHHLLNVEPLPFGYISIKDCELM